MDAGSMISFEEHLEKLQVETEKLKGRIEVLRAYVKQDDFFDGDLDRISDTLLDRISDTLLDKAQQFCLSFMQKGVERPKLYPTHQAEVQAEWSKPFNNKIVEIVFRQHYLLVTTTDMAPQSDEDVEEGFEYGEIDRFMEWLSKNTK